MEDFLKEAESKGLYAASVESDKTKELFDDFSRTTAESDKLCEVTDPVTAPYESKYKARDLLDVLTRKLEATRTIAFVENKRNIVSEIDWRVASIRVRLGIIAWECEEPHNAQTELEDAAEFYCKGFVAEINSQCKGTTDQEKGDSKVSPPHEMEEKFDENALVAPSCPRNDAYCVHAIKCLNILGILWAGRGIIKKAFLYLLAAKACYEEHASDNFKGLTEYCKVTGTTQAKARTDLDSQYTHNLFYLAQAYGNVGNSAKSSLYCRETLQRQFDAGLNDVKTAFDWVKNCAGIADFYQVMQYYHKCSLALRSAEKVLTEKVLNVIQEEALMAQSADGGNATNGKASSSLHGISVNDVDEVAGDLHRRWARLDVNVLKRAYDDEMVKRHRELLGEPIDDLMYDVEQEQEEKEKQSQGESSVFSFVPPPNPSVFVAGETSAPPEQTKGEFFRGLQVEKTALLKRGDIRTFESARTVFLRAVSRLEAAKKKFPLDGCVSDHCSLLQDHSKLYHYLAIFEEDNKRKVAMETRRLDMLSPLLSSLNKIAFEALHKQISYELGETYLAVLEAKVDKFRDRCGKGGEVDVKMLKTAEIVKCNDYCRGAIASFTHFISMYYKSTERNIYANSNAPFEKMTLDQLMEVPISDPELGLISEEEIRPYLNAHFLSSRAYSKVITTASMPQTERARFLVHTLKRYEWLSVFAPALCKSKHVSIDEVFGEEIAICNDMKALLPAKIDRMYFYGESGLSI